MKHARQDYNRFQDPAGIIPEDEPVFILRGQDKHAAETVRFYSDLVSNDNGSGRIVEATQNLAKWMDEWPKKKEPDMPEEIN